MDTFSRLLMLNITAGEFDKHCLVENEWQLPHAAGDMSMIRWHTVIHGAATMDIPIGKSFTLSPGKLVLLPHNSAHRLSQAGNEPTYIVCGRLYLQHSARYFLTALPEVLFLAPEANSQVSHWLEQTIQLMLQVSDSVIPGTDALHCQQSSTFFTLAVREWFVRNNTEKNILNLLLHPRLACIIQKMLENPSHPWTVEELAFQAHMSRTNFAQLFRVISGATPLMVLTTLRLQLAAQMLSREALPVLLIAESVGYHSESAFHKAFVRQFNCTPGEYRKRVKSLELE